MDALLEKLHGLIDDIAETLNRDGCASDNMQLARELVGKTQMLCEEAKAQTPRKYDPNFGDDRICECGHPYYRHFDSYDDMVPVGCKYCSCYEFKEKVENVSSDERKGDV